MKRAERARLAKFRAGLILRSMIAGGWEPQDLIEKYGQDTVDQVADEIMLIAQRLERQGGGSP